MDYDLGYFDEETKKLEPLEYPFAPKIVSPMSPVQTVTHVSGIDRGDAGLETRNPNELRRPVVTYYCSMVWERHFFVQ